MSRIIDTTQYLDAVCSILDEGGTHVPVPVSGTSMCPFLHPGDTVYLDKPGDKLRIGDIVLYRRSSGQYVLHRIIRIGHGNLIYVTGDNQTTPEAVDSAGQVIAVVSGANRNGRYTGPHSLVWRFYGNIWRSLRPLRPLIGKLHNITKTH